jgi:hypothetical protein
VPGLAVFHHTSLRAFPGGQRPPLEAGTQKTQSLRFTLVQRNQAC